MLRRLPPLNALKAFEAAARHESFTRAEELCVTQRAVSQQVKALEAELGIKLFNRERRGVQSQARDRPQPPGQAFGCPEISVAPPRRPQGMDETARGRGS